MTNFEEKKLVLILNSFPQGSETFIVSKFLGLLNQGWDIHVLCTRFNQDAWEQFPELIHNLEARKRVHRTWPIKPRWLAPLLIIPALLYCLVSAPRSTWRYLRLGWFRFGWGVFKRLYLDIPLIRLKPDILHFEFGSLAVGRTYLKEFLDCKLSLSFRGYDINYIGLEKQDYYEDIWKTADCFHFLGEDLFQRAQKRGAPENLPHMLIPPAIDLSDFPISKAHHLKKLETADHPVRILSVGRLHWKKGYEFNLQAIRLLLDRGVSCTYEIIGDGDYSDALYFARHQMGLKKVVDFIGGLPHAEVIALLAEADIFLHG
ncbi:MAG: glycosyltransferase, partial [Desulfobacteraceae bacterium]|nr:glycosyltransferase [Desulfobacteraceae bacterium]